MTSFKFCRLRVTGHRRLNSSLFRTWAPASPRQSTGGTCVAATRACAVREQRAQGSRPASRWTHEQDLDDHFVRNTTRAEEFLERMGITAYRLAKNIDVPQSRISKILSGERAMTADTALRLSRFFGMSEGFWINAQADCDKRAARVRPVFQIRKKGRPPRGGLPVLRRITGIRARCRSMPMDWSARRCCW